MTGRTTDGLAELHIAHIHQLEVKKIKLVKSTFKVRKSTSSLRVKT